MSQLAWRFWHSLADRDRHRMLIDRGLAALETQADSSGLYHLDRGRPQAIWPTAMVVATRIALGQDAERSARRLLEVRGRTIKGDPEVQNMFDIDSLRVGWPWAEGTFAWVEPTAWAVLALRAAGYGNHPRVIEGAKLLLDRAFDSGGINYGNRHVLGSMTEPIPGPTAIMLLALQGHNELRVQAARQYLMTAVAPMSDLEHLGWAKLALACHAHDPGVADFLANLDERIRAAYEAQNADGRPVSVPRHALVALALGCAQFHPFRLTGEAARPVPAEGESVPPAKAEDPPRPGMFEAVKGRFRNLIVRGLGALAPTARVRRRPHRACGELRCRLGRGPEKPIRALSSCTCRFPAGAWCSSPISSSIEKPRSSTPIRALSMP